MVFVLIALALLFSCTAQQSYTPDIRTTFCFVSDGTLFCRNSEGQVKAIAKDVSEVEIDEGGYTFCFTVRGEVFCQGRGSMNRVFGYDEVFESPRKVASGIWGMRFGRGFACAISSDGGALCFGDSRFGRVPGCTDFCNVSNASPLPITEKVVKVDTGKWHACALTENKNLYCWGRNWDGQVGTGKRSGGVSKPEKVLENVDDFCTGGWHTCAVVRGREVWCWGEGWNGQISGSQLVDILKPGKFHEFEDVRAIDCGQAHTCVLAGDELVCWGWTEKGQLKQAQTKFLRPTKVEQGVLKMWVDGDATCVQKSEGVLCWGDGNPSPFTLTDRPASDVAIRKLFYLWDP